MILRKIAGFMREALEKQVVKSLGIVPAAAKRWTSAVEMAPRLFRSPRWGPT